MILIKGELFFDPERRRLLNGEKETPLTDNMSRCLVVLLNNKGDVVSKETLLKEVWEKKGVIVTVTSIRQTLSQLRKSFASLGVTEELIYTLPRQGYKIAKVTQASVDYEPEASVVPQSETPDAETPSATDYRILRWPGQLIKRLLLIFVTVLTVTGLSLFIYFRYYFVTDVQYVRISDNATREILISDTLHTDKAYISSAMHALDSYIDGRVVKVPASYQVYINRTLQPDVYSFFICNRAGISHDCQAVYIHNGLVK